eukprot:GHVQ01039201.1.p1 GENE.GHVQ01039201.1~~GHVQ01039201.1.p1  ORF type:complete len:159 (+),score=14.21 GHVQ01039201.1:76-552(+)
MADSVMYVATPRFLRRQPTVIAEAQRVKNKENLQVEKLVKLPTSVGCKRALKKWTIGWLLVILVQSAFCLNPFITPVVAGEIVEVNSCCIQFFIGTALVISCIGLVSFLVLLCVQNDPSTLDLITMLLVRLETQSLVKVRIAYAKKRVLRVDCSRNCL